MRPSVKRSLTGFLVSVALTFSAVDAYAGASGNSRDAFIGIAGGGCSGHPLGGGSYTGCAPDNDSRDAYRTGHGGYGAGANDDGYYRGY